MFSYFLLSFVVLRTTSPSDQTPSALSAAGDPSAASSRTLGSCVLDELLRTNRIFQKKPEKNPKAEKVFGGGGNTTSKRPKHVHLFRGFELSPHFRVQFVSNPPGGRSSFLQEQIVSFNGEQGCGGSKE
jgi:hypothetical protein